MNHEKTREFFSAYYEGSLELGLRQSFEQRLRSDDRIKLEYEAFKNTMDELATLKFEEIEVPSYLSDRIATRIEQAQSKEIAAPWWQGWLPRVALGMVAVAAVVGAVVSIPRDQNGNSGPSMGGLFGTPHARPASQINVEAKGTEVVLNYRPGARQVMVVTEVRTGQTWKYDHRVSNPMQNSNATPALFTVQIQDDTTHLIAVPGTSKLAEQPTTGSGTLQEFAYNLSGKYQAPVLVNAADLKKHVSWKLDESDALAAATKSLDGTGLAVDMRSSNLITISDH